MRLLKAHIYCYSGIGGSLLAAMLILMLTFAWAQDAESLPVLQDIYDPTCRSMEAIGRVPPSDYRKATQRQRELVEKYHFNEHYMAYRNGKSKFQKQVDRVIETPSAGFNYTLWAFPNHPQALAAMEDLGYRGKTENPQGSELKVHCYFQRAIRVAPDDIIVRALYGYYHARRNQPQEARKQFSLADANSGKSDRNVQSYLAWGYIQIGDLDAAVVHASRAYELGYQLPGLKDRLAKLGRTFP